jgi:hypothetical protein
MMTSFNGPLSAGDMVELRNTCPAFAEGRIKGLFVGYRQLLAIIRRQGARWPACIEIMETADIPPDATVFAVHNDPERFGFVFYVAHPSFAVVPEGEQIPPMGPMRMNIVRLAVEDYQADLVNYLEGELQRFRAIFGDLRNDDAKVDNAYKRGVEDCQRIVAQDKATPTARLGELHTALITQMEALK